MARDILTQTQKLFLTSIVKTPLVEPFYFTGGTALAHFYLQHRLSEDLDFFSETDVDSIAVSSMIRSMKSQLQYKSIDIQTSFNRNLYFLHFSDRKVLKLEFTYFPFPQIEKPQIINGLQVDSLLDIAVNKLFTIAQKPRGRDYYDLYAIIKKQSYSIEQLRKLAKQKFDWHVDPLQLGTQLSRVEEFLDDPILVDAVNLRDLVEFFQKESVVLKNDILK